MWTTFKCTRASVFQARQIADDDVGVVFKRSSAASCAGWEILHQAYSFLQKKKSKSGGAEPGLERWSKDELQRGGEEEFLPQSLLHADDDPPPTTASFELAGGLEVTNIMDAAAAACFICLLRPNWTQLQFISGTMVAGNGGCCAPSNAVMQCDFTTTIILQKEKGKVEASLWCRAALNPISIN